MRLGSTDTRAQAPLVSAHATGQQLPAPVNQRAQSPGRLSQGCALSISLYLPAGEGNISTQEFYFSKQAEDEHSHNKWSFPTLTFLTFPAIRSL